MGIASAWGLIGAVNMLLVFGHFFATLGKSFFVLCIDPILIIAAIVGMILGPSLAECRLKRHRLVQPITTYWMKANQKLARLGRFCFELDVTVSRIAYETFARRAEH